MREGAPKTAVLLLNLGGPDSLMAVRPFLYNLFYDPAIIALPNPFRWILAQLISRLRSSKAKQIYAAIGGKSPLLENTQAQAQALEKELPENFRVWPVMRYWHPRAKEVLDEVMAWGAEEIILLPLYPQFSKVTTGSSFKEIQHELARRNTCIPVREIPSYPTQEGWIQHWQREIQQALLKAKPPVRILFSAHGILEETVAAGDPYQKQVEETVATILAGLPPVDATICYQSRVGPKKWLEPDVDAEIKRAGASKVGTIVLAPTSFVSEHSETLYELDIEYRALSESVGISEFIRIRTPGTDPGFMRGLSMLVMGEGKDDLKTFPL